ncbi:MAG: VOC family protein [Thermoplasmata archaeon]|nr:VOC family protein [Thermoplasmata archaeon]
MATPGRPGPKPKRLYVRTVRLPPTLDEEDLPPPRKIRALLDELERIGRLVAHGELTEPRGDLLIIRANDMAEADRALRVDPFRAVPAASYEIAAWNPGEVGSGVNLDPPPARGAGRLTLLQRVAVAVRDQESALAFYRDVLGLVVRARDPDSGYVELALGKGTAGLSLIAPRPEWGEPYYSESKARIGARTGIAFETDSVAALEMRLRTAGARVTEASRPQPWGGVALRFSDPDGNEFLAFQRMDPAPGAGSSKAPTAPRRKRH